MSGTGDGGGSSELSGAVLESAPDAVVVVDQASRIMVINTQAEHLFGYQGKELLGQPLAILIPEPYRRVHASHEAGYFAYPRTRPMGTQLDLTARRKDGSTVPVEISLGPLRSQHGILVIAVIRDVTERRRLEQERAAAIRKQTEADLLQRTRWQEALSALIVDASGTDNVGRIMNISLDQARRALDVDAAVIWLGRRFQAVGVATEVAAVVDRGTREAGLELALGDLIIEDWNSLEPLHEARLFAPMAAQVGIRATLAVPIMFGKQRAGSIAVLSRSPRPWMPEDLALLKLMSREVGAATERLRTQGRILRQLESLTTLYASAKKLSESLDPDAVAAFSARAAVESFGVQLAILRRAEPDGSMRVLASYPEGIPYTNEVSVRWDDSPDGQGVSGRAYRSALPAVVKDVTTEIGYPANQTAGLLREGFHSEVALPLISRDKPFGVLVLLSREIGHSHQARIEYFQAFANLVAGALDNAHLFQNARRRLDHLEAMRDIDSAISGSLDARVTMSIFLDKTTSRLGVDAADILLLNPATQTLEYLAERGFRTPAVGPVRLQLRTDLAGQAALERRIVSVPDLRMVGDHLLRPGLLTDEGFVTYFGVPLIAKGELRGVLEVFHREPLRPDPEWMDFLSTLAGQAAIALESTSMFDHLQRAHIDLTLAYDTTLEGWSRAMDMRDKETEGHTQRVTELTVRLARAMGLTDDALVHVRRGALLHDIGKMGIPDSILLKPAPLTEDEWEIMRRHPVYAHELLAPIPYLRPALAIPHAHHEKWDGGGYPRGLKGEEIPLEARVFAVVDVWDALTSDRPYRAAWSREKARNYIREQVGRHFDPRVAEVFLQLITDRAS
ncbi:MAG TPA: HD domain-containing phosphohydrolase [bacterium]|jgi:PAS domain S-box-containing protein|nr:HD domain-containing phosphohydrolase [bacterium]